MSVVVVGAGAMGRGIAQLLAVAGHRVWLADANPTVAAEALDTVGAMVDRLAAKGRLTDDPARVRERLATVTAEPARWVAVAPDLVIEAVVEDLTVKRELFAELERRLPAYTILATNTSSLSITSIAAGLQHPERVVGLHFFNPVPLMRLVEVVPGESTEPAVVERMEELVRDCGHTPVRVRDTPGFLVNHAGRAYSTEALRIVDEGVAAPVDVDRVCREAAGFRMGPFELLDLTGLDVSQPVMESVYHGFYEDPRLRPSPTGRRRLAAGRLGRKSGGGFYTYTADGHQVTPDEAPAPAYDGTPVWVDGADPATGAALRELLSSHGVAVEEGPAPSPAAVALVAPYGKDVTTAALAAGLPADRCLGVDPLGGFAGRLTLATNPGTSAPALRHAHAALAATGQAVTVVRDGVGFLAQRIVAGVVNLGCEIAQLGLAAPAEVDTAVTVALGYPRGPLAWGDEIGPARVYEVLQGLQAAYGDPRYRPSPWLSRRARLGLSLRHVEAR
ncbi:3-hydroxyacyl-CoA dehydrogenase [soil metagenome]|jgi:3-hydroxybutyryl-CoA dehydrogenase